ncbi:MAG TPA: amidohydrolase family protein [Edaphobacter sp.]|nr:amidohydrolase family protein [Edaphobacter sp.]
MNKVILYAALVTAIPVSGQDRQPQLPLISVNSQASVSHPFSDQELKQFRALEPIDTHTHAYVNKPEFQNLLKRLNVRIVDIILVDDQEKIDEWSNLPKERKDTWNIVDASNGSVFFCTTFDPFQANGQSFQENTLLEINQDFDRGAVALKIWKNIGEEVKNKDGKYILPDDPMFNPIYDDIAAHGKTLIAHVADPTTVFEAPNPAAPDYTGYMNNPGFYMYRKPEAPSKQQILLARDHILEQHPNLRVVGAHLGSMEADFGQLADHFDRYPNFAVDIAARMDYLVIQPRGFLIPFINKYQDRLIYGTDLEIFPGKNDLERLKSWENSYAIDWRFLATKEWLIYRGHIVQGLGLPEPILRKIYHDNAVKWFPGISSKVQ